MQDSILFNELHVLIDILPVLMFGAGLNFRLRIHAASKIPGAHTPCGHLVTERKGRTFSIFEQSLFLIVNPSIHTRILPCSCRYADPCTPFNYIHVALLVLPAPVALLVFFS